MRLLFSLCLALLAATALTPLATAHVAPCVGDLPCSDEPCAGGDAIVSEHATVHGHVHEAESSLGPLEAPLQDPPVECFGVGATVLLPCEVPELCEVVRLVLSVLKPFLPLCTPSAGAIEGPCISYASSDA